MATPLGLTLNFCPTTDHLTALKVSMCQIPKVFLGLLLWSGELTSLVSQPWDIWLSQIPPLPTEGGNQGNTLIGAYNM